MHIYAIVIFVIAIIRFLAEICSKEKDSIVWDFMIVIFMAFYLGIIH